MRSNSVIKTFRAEGDQLLRRRKHAILSARFPDAAKPRIPSVSAQGDFRRKCVPIVAATAVIVIAFAAAVPFLRQTSDIPVLPTPNPDSVPNAPSFDPALWAGVVDTPYAVISIQEITEDTALLPQDNTLSSYVKVRGTVLASYHTEAFYASDPAANGTDNKTVPFDRLDAFYVTEASVPQLREQDTVLICVARMSVNGQNYYGPLTDGNGISEYLPIVNGALQIGADDYDTRSFRPLRILNDAVDEMAAYLERGGQRDELAQAFPVQKIENGSGAEDLDEFLRAWDYAKTLLIAERRWMYPDSVMQLDKKED